MELICTHYNRERWFRYNEFRINNRLCDGIIVAKDGKQFPVHRLVLFIRNDFFRKLLEAHEADDSGEWRCDIPLDSAMVSAILDHVYVRQTALSLDKVIQVYEAAVAFQVPSLASDCLAFLGSQLDENNVMYFAREADRRRLDRVKQVCLEFLYRSFRELPADVLNQMSAADFQVVIANDRLNVRSEEELFESIISWIAYDPKRRSGLFPELIAHVRLGLVRKNYFLHKIMVHPYASEHWSRCNQLLIAARRLVIKQQSHNNNNRLLDLCNPLIRPRIPRSFIIIVGGWSRTAPVRSVEVYDPMADMWFFEANKRNPTPVAYHGLVEMDKKLYVLGGFDGDRYLKTVNCFDPERLRWRTAAPLSTCRCYVSAAICRRRIYACGGFNGDTRMKSVERYDPVANRWTIISDMQQVRSDASATSINGKVYVAGGFNGRDCLDTAEVYDPDEDEWTELARMSTTRSGLCLRVFQGCIYAIGGFNGAERLRSVERFDETDRSWHPVADMLSPRSNFAAVALEDKLYVIGGYGGTNTIYDVECFDGNQWHHVSSLNVRRSASQACVLSDLANVTEYTFHNNYL